MVKQTGLDLPESPYYTERSYPDWRDRFTINWLINRDCTFNCMYCIKPDDPHFKFEVDEAVEAFRKFAPLRLAITGGEPLLVPNFIELCHKLGEFAIIELQTNFTIKIREFIDTVKPECIERFLTTYHPKQRNEPFTKQRFIDDVLYARKQGHRVDVFFVDYPEYTVDYYMEECKRLFDAGIVPMRKRYNGDFKGDQYVGDAKVFTGIKCNAGHKFFAMWENFDMTLCDTGREPLGNLLTGYKLNDGPITCPVNFCGCLGRENILEPVYDEFYKVTHG